MRLLDKFSPALEQVDSSSGALGAAANRAMADTWLPLIAKADVEMRATGLYEAGCSTL